MKKRKGGSKARNGGDAPSRLIGANMEEPSDWRGDMLDRIRRLVHEAVPEVVEEVKWRKPSNSMLGVPVWSHAGIICTGETYNDKIKLTFAKGASLEDPAGLFNASLDGKVRRAIDFHEGDKIDQKALKALIRAAAALNTSSVARRSGTRPQGGVTNKVGNRSKKPVAGAKMVDGKRSADTRVRLLSGGNPQIAKADGDAPVQAYIAAMPGWKRDVGRRLDALIVRTIPGVRKAVKWNSPFYGMQEQGWFLSFHCFTKYVKVTFFRGTSLRPVPPGESKHKDVRYLDIHEDDGINEAKMARWVKQAAALPGWSP